MGVFAYVVPLDPEDYCIIICIDLVLPMGWVDSPKFFCAFSETLTDLANTPVDTELPIPDYGDIAKIPTPPSPPPHIHPRDTHPYLMLYG